MTAETRQPRSKEVRFALSLLILLIPSILTLIVLWDFFPTDKLSFILVTPITLGLNFLIAVGFAAMTYRKLWFRLLRMMIGIGLTCWITIACYPQDPVNSIEEQTREAIQAIKQIDEVSRTELISATRYKDPRYVVALSKYLDEIPFDGTYQLYGHRNLYGDNYTLSRPSHIFFKLKGYHKAMWLYLRLFER